MADGPLDRWTEQPTGSAATAIGIGFVGSVIGLVYGLPYTFDRVWFLLSFVVAVFFAFVALKRWIAVSAQAEVSEINPELGLPHAIIPEAAGVGSTESRTLEENASPGDGA